MNQKLFEHYSLFIQYFMERLIENSLWNLATFKKLGHMMQRLGLLADSFKRWWWELVRVAKIMWGIIMKEASSSSLLSSLSWVEPFSVPWRKDTLYKIDPPIWKWEEAQGRFCRQLTLWTLQAIRRVEHQGRGTCLKGVARSKPHICQSWEIPVECAQAQKRTS